MLILISVLVIGFFCIMLYAATKQSSSDTTVQPTSDKPVRTLKDIQTPAEIAAIQRETVREDKRKAAHKILQTYQASGELLVEDGRRCKICGWQNIDCDGHSKNCPVCQKTYEAKHRQQAHDYAWSYTDWYILELIKVKQQVGLLSADEAEQQADDYYAELRLRQKFYADDCSS